MTVKRKKNGYPLRLTLSCILIFALVSAAVLAFSAVKDAKSINLESDVNITVNSGWGINKTAEKLHEEKIIKYPYVFELISKLSGFETSVQPGPLTLSDGMSYKDILKALSEEGRDNIKITIPEGYEIRQIAEDLSNAGLIDTETFYAELDPKNYSYKFLEDIPKRENPLEGYLFPATYSFSQSMSEHEIIDQMLKAFDDAFDDEFYARAKKMGKTIDEIITMASIIERESNSSADRAKVAGVFYNRLEKNMKLQSCATVQYILKDRKAKLSTADTKINSPYNTYVNSGLPIGPIASPGLECIRAALYPEDTDALYFVLGKDGKHIFSKTYEDHLAAKQDAEN